MTFGGTKMIRDWAGIDGGVDICSTAYKNGERLNVTVELAITGGLPPLSTLQKIK